MDVGTRNNMLQLPGDDRSLEQVYRDGVESAVAAEQDGYDYFHCNEVHFNEVVRNPSPLILLSAVSSRTSAIRLGTCVLLPPFYYPLRLAEDLAVLDLLSGGRVDVMSGTGADMGGQFERYGLVASERWGRTFETLEILRRTLNGEPAFDHEGKYFTLRDVKLTLTPLQQPFPIWFVAHGPKTARRAGLAGYDYHADTTAIGTIADWEAALSEAGHDRDECDLGIHSSSTTPLRVVATAAESQQVREELGVQRGALDDVPHDEDVAFGPPPTVGTPDELLARLEPLLKDSAVTHFTAPPFGVDPESRRSARLWLDEVVPVLRSWGRTPRAKRAAAAAAS